MRLTDGRRSGPSRADYGLGRSRINDALSGYYIEVGHERAVVPLSAAQNKALAAVEELLQRQSLWLEFDLQPGQMLFVNNHWILHNRTAFEDDTDPERRRHYSRLWLGRRGDLKNGKI